MNTPRLLVRVKDRLTGELYKAKIIERTTGLGNQPMYIVQIIGSKTRLQVLEEDCEPYTEDMEYDYPK